MATENENDVKKATEEDNKSLFDDLKFPLDLIDGVDQKTDKPISSFRCLFKADEYDGISLPRNAILIGEKLARNVSLQFMAKEGGDKGKNDPSKEKPHTRKELFEESKRLDPKVGAVIVRAKPRSTSYEAIGCCRGAFDGDNHAEYSLLNNCYAPKEFKEHDYFFTTLEPCTQNARNKWSRSCSKLLIDRKVKRIFIGLMDPNPLITGYGYFTLFKKCKEIEIRPFEYEIRKELVEDNKDYLSQFDYTDFETYRSMAISFDKYVNYDAIDAYIDGKYSVEGQLDPNADEYTRLLYKYYRFYQDMMMRRYIHKQGEGDVEVFVPTDEFALFFFNQPSGVVDGATIRIVKKNDKPKENLESFMEEQITWDGPISLFYDSGAGKDEKGNDRPSFMECCVINYGTGEDKQDWKDLQSHEERLGFFKRFTKNTWNFEYEAFREAIANALVHRDYSSGKFTVITFEEHRISIENPVKDLSVEMLASLQSYQALSDPRNPKLMRLFMDFDFAERSNAGMSSLSDIKARYVAKDRNTLVTIIELPDRNSDKGGKRGARK